MCLLSPERDSTNDSAATAIPAVLDVVAGANPGAGRADAPAMLAGAAGEPVIRAAASAAIDGLRRTLPAAGPTSLEMPPLRR